MKAVRFERRLELAMEGHRFLDLVRWGEADVVLNRYRETEFAKKRQLALKDATFIKGKHEYLPIPESEIINSSKMVGDIDTNYWILMSYFPLC